MRCKLHSVYNTLHTLCDITQKVSNHYTVEGQFFAFNLEKNYTGQKIFTQTPSVASVTNIGYVYDPPTIFSINHHDIDAYLMRRGYKIENGSSSCQAEK